MISKAPIQIANVFFVLALLSVLSNVPHGADNNWLIVAAIAGSTGLYLYEVTNHKRMLVLTLIAFSLVLVSVCMQALGVYGNGVLMSVGLSMCVVVGFYGVLVTLTGMRRKGNVASGDSNEHPFDGPTTT